MEGGPESRRRYAKLMAAQPWGELYADLLAHLLEKRFRPQEAEELTADTIARVYDPARSPWEPERGAPLFAHLQWVARSVTDNAVKKRKRQRTSPAGDDEHEPDPDSNRDAVARHAHDMMMAEQRDKLLAILADRPRALAVLSLEEEGVTTVDEQHARMPGATRAQVYEARRAVHNAARRLIDDQHDPDVRRAWGLREQEVAR